jgi:hypothetical protein
MPSEPTRVVALVADLMDRSRLAAAVQQVVIASEPARAADADVVVVDLARFSGAVAELRRVAPHALLVAYGPHVDEAAADAARAAGADRVLPRSRFFRDPAEAIRP